MAQIIRDMFFFSKRSHLQYESTEEWIKAEKIPIPVTKVEDEKTRNKYLSQHSELRRHLFEKHLYSLPLEEQQLLKAKKHPSQSHAFAEAAQNYLVAFKKEMPILDCVEKVGLGNYHGDQFVIDVLLKSGTDSAQVRKHFPQFYRGFEVMLLVPKKPN